MAFPLSVAAAQPGLNILKEKPRTLGIHTWRKTKGAT